MLDKKKREYLQNVYFTPKSPGSFGSVQKVWKHIREDGVVSLNELKQWLLEQDEFTSYRSYKQKFRRPRVVVPYVDAVWGTDVAHMTQFAKDNDNFGYFVVFIDLFSRFAFASPLKTLKGVEMKATLQELFTKGKCEKLFSDRGTEYVNKVVENYLKSENVQHYTSLNEKKVAHAERLIKNIKKKLFKYMNYKNTRRWVDVLEPFIQAYNNTYHRTIQMTPAEARKSDSYTVWTNQYEQPRRKARRVAKPRNKSLYRFKIGDRVKLLALRKPFDREYQQAFTTEVFTIIDRAIKDGIDVYSIKDELNKPILGKFYANELTRVIVPDDKTYKIEKVLKRRTRNGRKEIYVKWLGYNNSFNSWVEDIVYL